MRHPLPLPFGQHKKKNDDQRGKKKVERHTHTHLLARYVVLAHAKPDLRCVIGTRPGLCNAFLLAWLRLSGLARVQSFVGENFTLSFPANRVVTAPHRTAPHRTAPHRTAP